MAAMARRYLDFWLEFAVPRAKLAVFRVCFFTLIGIDGLLQLPHAPRYGAGGFNVGHVDWLQGFLPGPERSLLVVVFLLQAYLGFRIALGRISVASVRLLTALYGYGYFVSQLDSYQHHYLIFLLLLACSFVPWTPAAGDRSGPSERPVRSLALRLVIVQVAIVYFWAALTKCEGVWLDGTVLQAQLRAGMTHDVASWLGMDRTAQLITATEFFLALSLLYRRLWPLALVVGVGLHAGIEFAAEFQIDNFSYYMFAFYLLLLPDAWFIWCQRRFGPLTRRIVGVAERLPRTGGVFWAIAAAGLLLGWLVLRRVPLAEMSWVAGIASATALTALLWQLRAADGQVDREADGPRRPSGLAGIWRHVIATALVASAPFAGEAVGDYYKYWGGSARRLGEMKQAETAYRHLVGIRPGWAPAHYHLGRIAQQDQRIDEALAHYRRAQTANSSDYRAFLNEALIHHQASRGPETLVSARQALAAMDAGRAGSRRQRDRQRLQQLIAHWSQSGQ